MDKNLISQPYTSIRYSDKLPDVTECYLCGKKLEDNFTQDHIIPNMLFHPGDEYRPKLYVHSICNRQKSLDDEWFVHHVRFRSSVNPVAEGEFVKFLDKAATELPDAYILGKNPRNLKLAKKIIGDVSSSFEIKYGEKDLVQFLVSEENSVRFKKYVETMCRGLFIRNVSQSNPQAPEIRHVTYTHLEMLGKLKFFTENIKQMIEVSESSRFGQQWGDRITYIGSRVAENPNKGFLLVQFYSQFCIEAFFR